jgi:hypothetical protein
MTTHHRSRAAAFLSLDWYEVALRFLFSFVAKTSEVLLAAGLVVSTANFLTDGSLLATHPDVSVAWAWAQALAIDSSLGVSLASTFQYLKQGAWIKGLLYGLLTLLLAGVAGAITTVDIVSHALHITTGDAMFQMDLNISMVSRLRAIAVIGFMLMSRLRDLPLQSLLVQEEEPGPQPTPPHAGIPLPQASTQAVAQSLLSQFSAQEVAQIVNACVASGKVELVYPQCGTPVPPEAQNNQRDSQGQELLPNDTGPSEKSIAKALDPGEPLRQPRLAGTVPEALTVSAPDEALAPEPVGSVQGKLVLEPTMTDKLIVPEKERLLAPYSGTESQHGPLDMRGPDPVPQEEPSLERDQRLEQAYQSLLEERKKPSGRALAERVHIHRATCVAWLREKQRQSQTSISIENGEDTSEIAPDVSVSGSSLEPLALAGDLLEETDDASPGVPPASHLPEDTPPL